MRTPIEPIFDILIDDAQRKILIAALKSLPGYSEDEELLIGMLRDAKPYDLKLPPAERINNGFCY